MYKCIKSIKNAQEEKRYIDTTKTLQEMYTLLDNPHSLLQELEIYAAIKDEYCNLFCSYSMEVSGLLRDRICWNSAEESDKTIISIQ